MDWDAEPVVEIAGRRSQKQQAKEERRRLGQYATPPALVEQMLEWVGYRPQADLEEVTLLDPACGTGNFLAAAAERLLACGQAQGWSSARLLAALQNNLCGIEADPLVCAAAETRLRALVAPLQVGQPGALAALDTSGGLRFQLHQGDALALPAAPRYQLVLSNPPYLSSRKHPRLLTHAGFLSAGQRDAYLLFVEQACRWVAPEGWLGLVLPDAFLTRANAAQARRVLCHEFVVTRLEHLAGVFQAQVSTVVLIAQRARRPAAYTFPWHRLDRVQARQQQEGTRGAFAVEVWQQQPRVELRYLLGPAEAALFARLAREVPCAPLGDLVAISRGEEMSRRAQKLLTVPEGDCLPVLRGGRDVLPFRCRFAGVYLPRALVEKPLARYQTGKLLVVKSSGRLCAALDEQGAVALQTLYLLHLQAGAPAPDYLLALLNSRLLRGVLWLLYTAYKLVQPQIEQGTLARLPVPLLPAPAQQELANLAAQLRLAHQQEDAQRQPLPAQGVSCGAGAGWVQLEQTTRELTTRLDARIAALCGLSAAEEALLEQPPVESRSSRKEQRRS
jgi:SAM-dependent methyltransferase